MRFSITRATNSGFQGADILERRIAALPAFDAKSSLGAFRLPALVAAARDVLVPSTISEDVAAAITRSRLHIAPRRAHALNVTKPADFDSLFLDCHADRQP